MLNETYPYYIANKPQQPNTDLEVTDKYTGDVVTRVAKADLDAVDQAIASAHAAVEPMRQLKAYQRQAVLQHCVDKFEQRAGELAMSLCIEAGKPIKDARGEVTRLIDTFRIAAEEAVRIYGEVQPLDISQRGAAYSGMWKRVPIGACGFITPFNFPLNLCAHKVAPAIAVGCPFVLKPASNTPIGALIIGEVLAETDLPDGAFSIVTCSGKDATPLVEDDRLKRLSFTGSQDVGWGLKNKAGKKQVTLELGGNAACIVDETWHDLDDAVQRLMVGCFYQSGQSCISVQRILIHESIYDTLRDKLIDAAQKLKAGDPKKDDTFIGPIISESEAKRVKSWIDKAIGAGANILCGGTQDGRFVHATLLDSVPADQPVSCDEVFGPVAVLSKFTDYDDALRQVNDSAFGLQAGVFTRDLYRAHQAWDQLEVGGVIVGDVPSYRVDNMPYGGVKDSGLGREGIRFAIEDMTEIRLMVVRTP